MSEGYRCGHRPGAGQIVRMLHRAPGERNLVTFLSHCDIVWWTDKKSLERLKSIQALKQTLSNGQRRCSVSLCVEKADLRKISALLSSPWAFPWRVIGRVSRLRHRKWRSDKRLDANTYAFSRRNPSRTDTAKRTSPVQETGSVEFVSS